MLFRKPRFSTWNWCFAHPPRSRSAHKLLPRWTAPTGRAWNAPANIWQTSFTPTPFSTSTAKRDSDRPGEIAPFLPLRTAVSSGPLPYDTGFVRVPEELVDTVARLLYSPFRTRVRTRIRGSLTTLKLLAQMAYRVRRSYSFWVCICFGTQTAGSACADWIEVER